MVKSFICQNILYGNYFTACKNYEEITRKVLEEILREVVTQ